jgi:hypothetical protein
MRTRIPVDTEFAYRSEEEDEPNEQWCRVLRGGSIHVVSGIVQDSWATLALSKHVTAVPQVEIHVYQNSSLDPGRKVSRMKVLQGLTLLSSLTVTRLENYNGTATTAAKLDGILAMSWLANREYAYLNTDIAKLDAQVRLKVPSLDEVFVLPYLTVTTLERTAWTRA